MATAMSAGACSIALKTDALARADDVRPRALTVGGENNIPYVYIEEP
jgi:hypothetical protein